MTFAVEWVVNITHESSLRVTCDETDDHAHPPDQDHAQSCVPHVGHPVQRLQCPAKQKTNKKRHSIQAVSRTTCRTSGTSAPVPCKNHKDHSMQAVSRINNALPTILDPTAAAGSYCSDTVTLGPVGRFGLVVKALGW